MLQAQNQSALENEAQLFGRLGMANTFSWLQPMYQSIKEYGCWCHFEENYNAAKGKPMDQLDGICKSLHMNYECGKLSIDNLEERDACIPWETPFHHGLKSMMNNQEILNMCEIHNPPSQDLCAYITCKAESIFIFDIFRAIDYDFANLATALFDDGIASEANKGQEAYQARCFSENFNNRDKQCCGSEAYQFLYNGARLGCCGERTYNPVFEECCGNGEVSVSCMSV